jgi:hypothetical protein
MSGLVRLYPRAWRDRYEAEFVDLLEQRPGSIGVTIDVVRGALDAHLHPQDDAAPMPWTHRLPGVAVLATGLLWSAATLQLVAGKGGSDELIGLAAMTALIGLPGDYLMVYGRRIAAAFGVVALAIVLMFSLPWEISVLIFFGVATLVLGGTLTMAAIRADIGAARRWLLLGSTVMAPLAVAAAVSTGIIDEATSRLALLVALPYGIAWATLGVRLIVRGSPTIIDPAPAIEGGTRLEMENLA